MNVAQRQEAENSSASYANFKDFPGFMQISNNQEKALYLKDQEKLILFSGGQQRDYQINFSQMQTFLEQKNFRPFKDILEEIVEKDYQQLPIFLQINNNQEKVLYLKEEQKLTLFSGGQQQDIKVDFFQFQQFLKQKDSRPFKDIIDEIIDQTTQQQVQSLPASLALQQAAAPPKLNDPFAQSIHQYHQKAVEKTQNWAQSLVSRAKNGLMALREALFIQESYIESDPKKAALVNNIEQRIGQLPVGTKVGQWTVRSSNKEKFLDNWQGQEVSRHTMSSLGTQQLSSLSDKLDSAYRQKQTMDIAPVLGQLLKAAEKPEFRTKSYSVNYNPQEKLLTFEHSNGDKLVALSLGNGKWQHVDGELSPAMAAKISVDLKHNLERFVQRKQDLQQNNDISQLNFFKTHD